MKKVLTKLLIILLCAGLSLSATACGRSNKINEDEDVESITYFRNDIESFNTARRQNTAVYKALKTAMGGVDVEVITASGSGWETVLSKLWFDQDLPDMFLCKGPDAPDFYDKLIRGDSIIAIDDYVYDRTKDEFPNLYEKMKETSYLAKNLTYAKGKQWAVPCGWELEKSLYVRQDWINNLNDKLATCLVGEGVIAAATDYNAATMYEQYKYKTPEDLLEFYRLARAFTLYDPDNNKKNDTYGYESEANTDFDAWIYIAFGAGWKTEMIDSATGKYISSDTSDEAMYATAFINRLLAEGYMSPNSITNDNATKQNHFSTGVSGMIFAHNWLNTFVGYMVDSYGISIEEATSRIAMCNPPKGRDGHYGADGGYDDFWLFTCINKNMSQKRIKTCLKLLDFMYSDEGLNLFVYGVEGVNYNLKTDETTGEITRENIMGKNKDGFYESLGSFDSGYQLYSLSWWTGHYYCEYTTNGDIIRARQIESSQYAYKVDYPYVQTQLYMQKISGMHDYFNEMSLSIINDSNGRYWQAYLEDKGSSYKFNLNEFDWDDIYDIPTSIERMWKNTFVKNYNASGNNGYYGTAVYEEYNNFIEAGNAQRR